MTIDTVRLTGAAASRKDSLLSMSVADEYDVMTGGIDILEQQVRAVG